MLELSASNMILFNTSLSDWHRFELIIDKQKNESKTSLILLGFEIIILVIIILRYDFNYKSGDLQFI